MADNNIHSIASGLVNVQTDPSATLLSIKNASQPIYDISSFHTFPTQDFDFSILKRNREARAAKTESLIEPGVETNSIQPEEKYEQKVEADDKKEPDEVTEKKSSNAREFKEVPEPAAPEECKQDSEKTFQEAIIKSEAENIQLPLQPPVSERRSNTGLYFAISIKDEKGDIVEDMHPLSPSKLKSSTVEPVKTKEEPEEPFLDNMLANAMQEEVKVSEGEEVDTNKQNTETPFPEATQTQKEDELELEHPETLRSDTPEPTPPKEEPENAPPPPKEPEAQIQIASQISNNHDTRANTLPSERIFYPNPQIEPTGKVKEIPKEDAAKIHEEFAEVGDDDVLQVIEEPVPEPIPEIKTERKLENTKLPPIRLSQEVPGKERIPLVKPSSNGSLPSKNEKLFYKRRKPGEKRPSEERQSQAFRKTQGKKVHKQLFDRPKTHADPFSHLASTVKSPGFVAVLIAKQYH
eukprot:TRINITY_DN87992_c1_g1_i1.p2 TRINITY_DN87992_c1_g1~~TRINITY_DN87992_c1_g1_i1.p2  ORF type:complete len:465 (-),score=59.84 TRINITY_DN87992_c1_g1_i1:665-2059(-)